MKKLAFASAAGVALTMALGGASFVRADERAPGQAADQSTIGEVVVTARRVEERLQDVPISITVFSQEQLTRRNIVTGTDLATYTPSLTTNQRYGSDKSSFVIRGFVQEQGTSPSVGVYFADVVTPRVMGGTTSGNGVLPGAFFDLQNVQVLKGPQGTLFGRNTTGGAVLLVPNRPSSELGGYVEASAGDYGMWRAQGVLNAPVNDSVRLRFGFDRMKRDGYMKNHSGIGPEDYNDIDYFAGRASMTVDVTPDVENYTILTYNHSFGHGYGARLAVCNPHAAGGGALLGPLACAQIARQAARGDGPLDVEINNPNPYMDIRQSQVINTLTWHASDNLTVKNTTSFSRFTERDSFSLNGENFTFAGQPLSYILLNPAPQGQNAGQKTFIDELQFQGRALGDKLDWQAGAYFEISDPVSFDQGFTAILLNCTDARQLNCLNPLGAGQISWSNAATSFRNKGFYGQATYKFTEKLSFTGGLRYTIDDTSAISHNTRIRFLPGAGGKRDLVCNDTLRFKNLDGTAPKVVSDPTQCEYRFETSSSKPTWLLDLDYKPTSDVLLYGKWARGYRQGGISTMNVGLETWAPEKVDAYEVGAKTSFRGPLPGYFNAAFFYNDFVNQQITAALIAKPSSGLAGGAAIVNAGKSKLWGFESDASVQLFENFRVDLGYSYLNTKLEALTLPTIPADSPFQTIIPTAVVGAPLAFSPKNRVTMTASYRLPLADDVGDVSLSTTFVHTDAQNATSPLSSPLYRLPPSNLLNLNLDWKNVMSHPVDFSVFATNVTNDLYQVGIGSSWSSAGFENLLYAPPRMYGVRVRYHFGG
jgi:iron complex outermembrane receptor protein